jgi:hypothetical protein
MLYFSSLTQTFIFFRVVAVTYLALDLAEAGVIGEWAFGGGKAAATARSRPSHLVAVPGGLGRQPKNLPYKPGGSGASLGLESDLRALWHAMAPEPCVRFSAVAPAG